MKKKKSNTHLSSNLKIKKLGATKLNWDDEDEPIKVVPDSMPKSPSEAQAHVKKISGENFSKSSITLFPSPEPIVRSSKVNIDDNQQDIENKIIGAESNCCPSDLNANDAALIEADNSLRISLNFDENGLPGGIFSKGNPPPGKLFGLQKRIYWNNLEGRRN